MIVACLDLEGVLVPEIWINVAERTGIAELRRTTRDEPNYDVLMKRRLEILSENKQVIPDLDIIPAHNLPFESDDTPLVFDPNPAIYERANYMLMLQSWRATR